MDITEIFARMNISPGLQPSRLPNQWNEHNYDSFPIIPPADRRLETIDLTNLLIPDYKNFSLYYLVEVLGFPAFAHNLQNKNRHAGGRLLDRPTTDAAWMLLVTLGYKIFKPEEIARDDELKQEKLAKVKTRLLMSAIAQTSNRAAAKYWAKKVKRFGDMLNVKSCLTPLNQAERESLALSVQKDDQEESHGNMQRILDQRWEMMVDEEEGNREEIKADLKGRFEQDLWLDDIHTAMEDLSLGGE